MYPLHGACPLLHAAGRSNTYIRYHTAGRDRTRIHISACIIWRPPAHAPVFGCLASKSGQSAPCPDGFGDLLAVGRLEGAPLPVLFGVVGKLGLGKICTGDEHHIFQVGQLFSGRLCTERKPFDGREPRCDGLSFQSWEASAVSLVA